MIVYSKVSKSFWYLLLSLINISLLTSCDWEGVGSSLGVLAALVLPGIVPCFFSGQLSPQYFVEIWQQFLWTTFDSNILLSFGSNSLWAAFRSNILLRFGSNVFGRLGFDSNILVSFGSNSLCAAFRSNIFLRFGSNFSGRLWQQYFGELRQQFSLGISRSNIFE